MLPISQTGGQLRKVLRRPVPSHVIKTNGSQRHPRHCYHCKTFQDLLHYKAWCDRYGGSHHSLLRYGNLRQAGEDVKESLSGWAKQQEAALAEDQDELDRLRR